MRIPFYCHRRISKIFISTLRIQSPTKLNEQAHVIADSREGWVESVRQLLLAFLSPNQPLPQFDYSLIRPSGTPIRGFGGTAQGPGILVELHMTIGDLLSARRGDLISETTIVVSEYFMKAV